MMCQRRGVRLTGGAGSGTRRSGPLDQVLAEHPTIGTVMLFGHTVWLGWLMIAALLYSAVPPRCSWGAPRCPWLGICITRFSTPTPT